MIQVCNVDGANDVDVTVQWRDASASNATTRLAYLATVPARDAISIQAGGLILDQDDTIQALASATGDAEITICMIEG